MKRSKKLAIGMAMVAAVVVVGLGISNLIIYYNEITQERLRNQAIPDLTCISQPSYTDADLGDLDETFVTAGDQISQSDATGWLVLPASQLAPQNVPVEAMLKADDEWGEDSTYGVTVEMPDVVFEHGRHTVINVYYPSMVKSGEYGTIVVFVTSDNGCVYCGFIRFHAADDLQLVHGSSKPESDYVDVWHEFNRSFTIYFYTSATSEHYESHPESAMQSGFYGRIFTNYIDSTQ